ncbi:hypothetical protein Dsin_017299 [Dipteronia sinensis]|uniref:Zinc knuckle CX2CX4HX4C domain-containing protein n=1 Tax=Dipteronia sinensis TaxID=43782 RepID=A0AAE0AFP3_9ROSI|nr:hypothetical protein Dsin_017299 [Dipteronia sinensis]
MVGLKYEQLPEFCYACGRIGHGSKDSPDEEARIGALNGATTKFGAWMRASVPDRLKVRPHLQKEGISKLKVSSPEGLHEVSVAGPLLLRSGLLDSQSGDLTDIVMASEKPSTVSLLETLTLPIGPGCPKVQNMWVEDPIEGHTVDNNAIIGLDGQVCNRPTTLEHDFSIALESPLIDNLETEDNAMSCTKQSDLSNVPLMGSTRKWKRLAREGMIDRPLASSSSQA